MTAIELTYIYLAINAYNNTMLFVTGMNTWHEKQMVCKLNCICWFKFNIYRPLGILRSFEISNINPQTLDVFRKLKTPGPKVSSYHPSGFFPSRLNFLDIFLMRMFSGSRNLTVTMKILYLYCMTLKIKVWLENQGQTLFVWPFFYLRL